MRRTAWAIALMVLCSYAAPGWAQGFKPARPVEAVVHTDPGGGSDVFARAIADMLEKEKLLPQRMNVLNKPGGSGATAMAYLIEKKGDDHTIGFFTNTWLVVPLTRKEAKVTIHELTPIARLVLEPMIAVVKADAPYKSMTDFVEAAKKNPGKLSQSGGSVTAQEALYRLVIQKATGAQWNFISFPGGGERISNLLGGNVQLLMAQPQEISEHIRSGSVRVIAVLGDKRLAGFPNVSTTKEQGLNIPTLDQARGVLAPPGVSREVVQYWEGVLGKFVKTESWKKYLADNQLEDAFLRSQELAAFWTKQTELLRGLLQEAGVKLVR
ncbi:MAG TPA: tripartite tricarboxylate transporter substrate binding protein [Candidatus Acidoferrales bacterium]|nr:tripartite tricarboxylate transporter substrate binding protein [Candidatus Acidoferrales bacterium]